MELGSASCDMGSASECIGQHHRNPLPMVGMRTHVVVVLVVSLVSSVCTLIGYKFVMEEGHRSISKEAHLRDLHDASAVAAGKERPPDCFEMVKESKGKVMTHPQLIEEMETKNVALEYLDTYGFCTNWPKATCTINEDCGRDVNWNFNEQVCHNGKCQMICAPDDDRERDLCRAECCDGACLGDEHKELTLMRTRTYCQSTCHKQLNCLFFCQPDKTPECQSSWCTDEKEIERGALHWCATTCHEQVGCTVWSEP